MNKRIILALTLFFLIFSFAGDVLAHGGGTLQIVNAPIADVYQVSVWSAPVSVRAKDDIHITVGIGTLGEGAPVLDATVQVEIYAFESNELIASEAATTEQSVNRLFYEADFAGLSQGDYDVVVTVNGSGGSGSVDFDLNVRPYLNVPMLVGGAVVVLLFLAGGLFVFKRQNPQPDPAPARQPRTRRPIS